MTRIAVFGRNTRPGVAALLEGAVAAGLRVVNQRQIFSRNDPLLDVDAVVVDSVVSAGAEIRDAYVAAGRPVYILELPRLRAASGPDRNVGTRLFGLYLNSLHYLPPRIGNVARVGGRLDEPRPGASVLVVGQKPGDTQHGMNAGACAQWARETVAMARSQFDAPVTYRPHPRAIGFHDPTEPFGADEVSLPAFETIRDALARASVLVTYNSTAGVDAIDAGVPVVYTAPAEFVCYAPYASPFGYPVRVLTEGERRTFLLRCASQCWTIEQLRSGEALRCLFFGEPWPPAELVEQDAEEALERDLEALEGALELATDAGVELPPVAKTVRRRAREVVTHGG